MCRVLATNSLWTLVAVVGVFASVAVVGCGPTSDDDNANVNQNQNDNSDDNQNDNSEGNTNDNADNENDNDNGEAGNQEPIADAGDDQTVAREAEVALDGSASSDPDDDELTFDWLQTAGTEVELSLAQPSRPTFTAPDEDVTLTFELTVDDGNGGTSTDTVSIDVRASATPQMYIANFTGNSIISYRFPEDVSGNTFPAGNLQGNQTGIDEPVDLLVDAQGRLFVLNDAGQSITIYNSAIDANGNPFADGNVSGSATALADSTAMTLDSTGDLLFVADASTDDILVFDGASDESFNGNIPPIRRISTNDGGEMDNPVGISLTADDNLYVANNGETNVLVFANASSSNGDSLIPNRVITSTTFTDIQDVYVDEQDRLFVVDSSGVVLIFNDAAGLNGARDPDITLTANGTTFLTAIDIDAEGNGYLVDNGADAILVFDDIATLNGAFDADRTIQGGSTQLDGAIHAFLVN